MELKVVNPTMVCGIEVRTCLSKLMENVGVKPQGVMDEIAAQNITPAGPQIWYYTDCDGLCQDAEFTLFISIPVTSKGEDRNGYRFTTLPEYRCGSLIHKGPWSEIPKAYEKLGKEIAEAGHKMPGTSREVYLTCDFENQANCVTEIQLEVEQ